VNPNNLDVKELTEEIDNKSLKFELNLERKTVLVEDCPKKEGQSRSQDSLIYKQMEMSMYMIELYFKLPDENEAKDVMIDKRSKIKDLKEKNCFNQRSFNGFFQNV